jgi:hypothetical protein
MDSWRSVFQKKNPWYLPLHANTRGINPMEQQTAIRYTKYALPKTDTIHIKYCSLRHPRGNHNKNTAVLLT